MLAPLQAVRRSLSLQRLPAAAARGVRGAFDHPLGRALAASVAYPREVDDYLQLIDATWSLSRVLARVVEVRHETADVTSLLLAPNGNWRGHRAGQHVLLSLPVGGVRQTRCFSLSAHGARGEPLRITIKAHPNGKIGGWARDHAQVGDVVTLSEAQGSFHLPSALPSKLLFVSGGSGITPLVAMAQQLVVEGYGGALTWIHSERDAIPLEADLRSLSDALGASLHVHRTLRPGQTGEQYLCAADIERWVPDWAQRTLFVCGPLGLMELVEGQYRAQGLGHSVHSEDYKPRLVARDAPRRPGTPPRLAFARSGGHVIATEGRSLLELAEDAGLRPAHGCRRGICHTCKCTKRSGTVRDALTGLLSDAPNEEIRLCIHTPVTDVSLDL